MRIIHNTGTERVIDLVRPWLKSGHQLDVVTSSLSLFAYSEVLDELSQLAKVRLVLPAPGSDLAILGSEAARAARNRLQARWLARCCAEWIENKVDLRLANGPVPQGAVLIRDGEARLRQAILGSFSFSTQGLGTTPGSSAISPCCEPRRRRQSRSAVVWN